MIYILFKGVKGNVSVLGMFLVFLGSNGCPWSLWICCVASLDVYETGWHGKLGLGKI